MGLDLGAYVREWADLPHDARWAWGDARLRGVAEQLRRRTVDVAYHRIRYVIVERQVGEAREVRLPEGVEIARLASPEIHLLAELMTAQAARELPTRLADEGRVCFVAWRGKRAIGLDWVSRSIDPELDGLDIPMPGDAVYTSGLFVRPRERGHGVGAALASSTAGLARELGYGRIWSAASPSNAAALPVIQRVAPCTPVGEAWLVRTPGRIRRGYEPVRNASAPTK
jgi:GNAT superfamily N-acetyltransferase